MSKRSEETFEEDTLTDNNMKILDILSHQGTAIQNHTAARHTQKG